MSRFAIIVFVIVAGVGASSPGVDGVEDELEKHQGCWVLVAEEVGGRSSPEDEVEGVSRVVKGDRVVRKAAAATSTSIIRLDPATEPKRYDAEIIEGPARGRLIHGIYELDGETLKTCADITGMSRPKKFSTKPGDNTRLQVWKKKG